MSNNAIERVRVKVTGRVQGVYYRASTREVAQRLGLCGWVRNAEDGAVEMEAEGPEAQIAELITWCHKGPPMAEVAHVSVAHIAVTGGDQGGFRVRY